MVFRKRKGREANEEQPAKLPTVGCETVGCESPAPTPDADVRRHSESLLLFTFLGLSSPRLKPRNYYFNRSHFVSRSLMDRKGAKRAKVTRLAAVDVVSESGIPADRDRSRQLWRVEGSARPFESPHQVQVIPRN